MKSFRRRAPRLKPYLKKLDYTYAYGVHPVLELMKKRPDNVLKLVFHSKGQSNQGIRKLHVLSEKLNIPTEVNDRAIKKISMKENTYVVGIFEKYQTHLHNNTNHILLHHARNMGNIGTIIRTMLGFGFYDLALIRPSADIFHPRLVRSTMGAIFKMRFEYFDSLEQYCEKFQIATCGKNTHQHNARKLYLSYVHENAQPISEIRFEKPFTLAFGNEGQGLPTEFVKAGEAFFIPQTKDIESLNLSVAAAIAMWEAGGSSIGKEAVERE